jgi:hypothetical protein
MIQKFDNKFANILEKIYKEKYNFNDDLKNFHKILETDTINENDKKIHKKIAELGKDRNSVFYDDYHEFIDNNEIFNETYYRFIDDHVKPLFSKNGKIVVQKTPNIRISFPNLTAIGKNEHENEHGDVIGIHKDSDFGHHYEEINFIIPITEMFETNSVYYEPFEISNISTNHYINLHLKKNEFFIQKLNKLLHFNRINQTGYTRISIDFRIIPYEKYVQHLDFFKDTKFELGKYFILM